MLEPGWLDAGDYTFARIAYTPAIPSAATIEIELDRFAEMPHRHTTLRVPW
jgi:hypothetical protein